jgi:uncharacterized protein (DUF1499 family)
MSFLSRLVWIGVAVSAAAALALVLAPLGTWPGWWTFRGGFTLLRWTVYLGLTGAGLSLAGGIFGRRWAVAAAGIAIGLGAAAVPWSLAQAARDAPAIHDITTDVVDPPRFVAILPLRADAPNPPEYAGSHAALEQRAAYPDIQPLHVAEPPGQAFDRALATTREMGWDLVAADRDAGRIEAVDTTFWFRFKDDVVVRIRETPAGVRIDARSKSRVGRGDAGANARRLRRFLGRLEES